MLKTCELKIKFTNFDSTFGREEDSDFTLLDPLHRPLTHLAVPPSLPSTN